MRSASSDLKSLDIMSEGSVERDVSDGPRDTCRVVELYEYEAKVKLFGWTSHFLPHGCAPWCDAEGRRAPRKSDYVLPQGWVWASEWVRLREGTDRDGWEYVGKKDSVTELRRRCWRRKVRKA
uniref:TECPR1-like DysF domain-containing protein n=1 Tax=Trypanosoma congolense (strain IL3000) TaxID=1068625 RepID=F9WFG4_TRYCI|nr:hypothetical protein, unlikely [Trypanosoma congolense IL3000]